MRYPKVTSDELFWRTLEEGSKPAGRSFAVESGANDVDTRVLRALEIAGGVATLFEVAVRAGVPRLRAHRAVQRLVKKHQVLQESGNEEDVVLRLSPAAR